MDAKPPFHQQQSVAFLVLRHCQQASAQGEGQAAARAHPFAFDALPLELWTAHIWPHLHKGDKAALRASCKAGSALSNQLILSLELTTACAGSNGAWRGPRRAGARAGGFVRRLPDLAAVAIEVEVEALARWVSGLMAAGPDPFPRSVQHLTLRCTTSYYPHEWARTLRAALQRLVSLGCRRGRAGTAQGAPDGRFAQARVRSCMQRLVASLPSLRSAFVEIDLPRKCLYAALWELACLPGLQELDLCEWNLLELSLEQLKLSLGRMVHLTQLRVPNTELNDSVWAALTGLPHLRSASFGCCRLPAHGSGDVGDAAGGGGEHGEEDQEDFDQDFHFGYGGFAAAAGAAGGHDGEGAAAGGGAPARLPPLPLEHLALGIMQRYDADSVLPALRALPRLARFSCPLRVKAFSLGGLAHQLRYLAALEARLAHLGAAPDDVRVSLEIEVMLWQYLDAPERAPVDLLSAAPVLALRPAAGGGLPPVPLVFSRVGATHLEISNMSALSSPIELPNMDTVLARLLGSCFPNAQVVTVDSLDLPLRGFAAGWVPALAGPSRRRVALKYCSPWEVAAVHDLARLMAECGAPSGAVVEVVVHEDGFDDMDGLAEVARELEEEAERGDHPGVLVKVRWCGRPGF